MPYQAKFYKKIQHVAFETPTYAANSAGTKQFREKLRKSYNLIKEDELSTDAQSRLLRLAHMVDLAYQRIIEKGEQEETLKVFTAPEFYFRPKTKEAKGGFRSYTDTTKEAILDNLQQMFSDKKYRNWLIVPGTIMWRSAFKEVEGLELSDSSKRTFSGRNTASMVKGGTTELHMLIADKIYPSDADELGKFGDHDKVVYVKQFMRSLDKRKHAITRFDNIGIGVEICLDHSRKTLRYTCQELGETAENYPDIDLQILLACGKTASQGALAVKKGGLFLRNDGNGGKTPSQIFLTTHQDIQDKTDTVPDFTQTRKAKDDLKRSAMTIIPINDKKHDLTNFSENLVIYSAQEFSA